MHPERYNGLLRRIQNIDTDVDNEKMDLLELFAQKESLTTSQITDIIESTKLAVAYKNVGRKIRKLESLGLVEDVAVDKSRRRHNEKYFKLRDEGIYLLFLKRLHGIFVDQISVKKGKIAVSYVENFLRYYNNNLIFELFLYPYFDRQTISVENFGLLIKLFNYLHECCIRIENTIRVGAIVPVGKFSWNKVPGNDSVALLTSLKEIFYLQDIDSAIILKDPDKNTIKVIAPSVSIVIELDRTRRKAIATVTGRDNSPRKHAYRIVNFGSEILVGTTQMHEESIKSILDSQRRLIEVAIYEMICNIGRSNLQEEMDDNEILAKDTKFMTLLENIHNNCHNDFEIGYHLLMKLRRNL